MPAKSKKVLQQFCSVQETDRVAGQAAGRGQRPEKANRQGLEQGLHFFSPILRPETEPSIASFMRRLPASSSGPIPLPGTTQTPKSASRQ
jgi:hypothetical protein